MSTSHGAPPSPIFLGTSPSHAERARTLVEQQRQGTLCTLLAPPLASPAQGHDTPPPDAAPAETPLAAATEGLAHEMAGFPYGSIVKYAVDSDGSPILLTSRLAEHTRSFMVDPRASLFVSEAHPGDVLALGRVTLLGTVERASEDDARARYLARHPDAASYADFRDFAFWRLRVQAIRYIGGFGRMSWTETAAYAAARPDPTTAFAEGVIAHMNDDHADSLVRLCRHTAQLTDTTAARMFAFDRWGFEMRAETPRGACVVRLGFAHAVATPEETRAAFILSLIHI